MRKHFLSTILFLGITATAFAQQGPQRVQKSPEERAERMTDILDKKLALTDDQKARVYQINLERAQLLNIFKGGKKDGDRPQMKAQFEASENRVLSVLDESQRETYDQLKAERKAKFKHKKGHSKQGSPK